MGRYPFGVELFHLLLHAGLSRRFLKYSKRKDTPGSCPTGDHRWSAPQARLLAPHNRVARDKPRGLIDGKQLREWLCEYLGINARRSVLT